MEKETLSMQDSFMVGFPALFYPLSFSFSASYNFPRQIEEKLAKMQTGYGTDNRFREARSRLCFISTEEKRELIYGRQISLRYSNVDG